MGTESIRVHIEVTYNGIMVARDEEQRFIASARHYNELRAQVRRGLRSLHGHEVAFALMVGSPRGPRAERLKALTLPGPAQTQRPGAGTQSPQGPRDTQ
jgi:hypothetical protein